MVEENTFTALFGRTMHARTLSLSLVSLLFACGDDGAASSPERARDPDADAPTPEDDPRDPASPPASKGGLTYFQDVAPIFAAHCMGCHREGGSGPFRLDDYASARAHAAAIAHATSERTMPPSYVLADGSCGEYADANQLSAAQIATIGRWADEGAAAGDEVPLRVPEVTTLTGGRSYQTPEYTPQPLGGELAATDDYHCFLFDAGVGIEQFITGFEVTPGSPVVHHAIAYVVDPAAPSLVPGATNAEVMLAHDAASPGVPGWSCLNTAGDGVATRNMPATWLPGQGAQELPNESGVRVRPGDAVVLQVHYNLAHAEGSATSDATHTASGTSAKPTNLITTMRFALAPRVKNEGFFVAGDGLLESIGAPVPVALPPGEKRALFPWSRLMLQLGFTAPRAELWGIYPHMHQLGTRFSAALRRADGTRTCMVELPRWNYHWQRMYSYAKPLEITPDTAVDVECQYDTSGRTTPVLPGMGTDNEMCSAIMYMTIPVQ